MADENTRCFWVWNGERCEKDHLHRGPHRGNNRDWPMDLTQPNPVQALAVKKEIFALYKDRIKALEQALNDAKAKVAPLEAKVLDMIQTIKGLRHQIQTVTDSPVPTAPTLAAIADAVPPSPAMMKILPAVAAIAGTMAPRDLRAVRGITADILPKGTQVVRNRGRSKKG
jgi:hypothetical protein